MITFPEEEDTSKVSARNLCAQHPHQRVATSPELLKLSEANPAVFLSRLVAEDEAWSHHLNAEPMSEPPDSSDPQEVPDTTLGRRDLGLDILGYQRDSK